MKIRYVGAKPEKTDNVAGTGVVWRGNGDIQEVPDAAWPRLARHPDVWEPVTDDEQQPAGNQQPPQGLASVPAGNVGDASSTTNTSGTDAGSPPGQPKFVLDTDDGPVVLDDMSREDLHTLAKARNVAVHHAAGADKVRAALLDAQAAK